MSPPSFLFFPPVCVPSKACDSSSIFYSFFPPLALFFFRVLFRCWVLSRPRTLKNMARNIEVKRKLVAFIDSDKHWLFIHRCCLTYLKEALFMAIYRIILSNILDEKWPHLNFSFHSCSQSLRQVSFDCCSDEFLFREWSMYSSSYVKLKRMHIRNPAPMERSLSWRRVLEGWGRGIE